MPNSLANRFMMAILESQLHRLLGPGFAVITVLGRRTGRRYSTPVNVQRDGRQFTVISSRSRTWWRNLRGGALGELLVERRRHTVQGEVVEEPDQVALALGAYFAHHPRMARHFDLDLEAAAGPSSAALERLATERVVIRLSPLP